MDNYFMLLALATLPAAIVGLVAYFSIQSTLKKELLKQKFQLLKANQKEALPIRLQSYERLTLFLDRISLGKLLVRIAPVSTDVNDYKNLLIATVNQEYEHNLTQQIYVSDACWKAVQTVRITIINQLHQLAAKENVNSVDVYRQTGLSQANDDSGVQLAQSLISNEVKELF